MDRQHAVEVDTMLSDVYEASMEIEQRLVSWWLPEIHRAAGDKSSYVRYGRGHRKTWGMSDEEALEAAQERVADDKLAPWDMRNARKTLDQVEAAYDDLKWLRTRTRELDDEYTGERWNRFYLVVSSVGHIHSDMSCSTCNPRTRFAWLPELSGLTAEDAVKEHGPALCSRCFPDAPVEWTVEKIKPKGDKS